MEPDRRTPPPFVLFTEAPPLCQGGIGANILSLNLLEALGDLFGLVLTSRQRVRTRHTDLYQAPGARTFVFPDASWFRPRRLVQIVNLLLFLASLPWLVRSVRRSGCRRIFALPGADPWFLPKADLLGRATRLPLDLYLIDDFEEYCRLGKRRWEAWLTRRIEPGVLRRAARVFTISPGYAEHLAQKYGQRAEWLPVPAHGETIRHSAYAPGTPDQRSLVFVGSVNALYLDSLCQLYEEIVRWNRSPQAPYELRLCLLTRVRPDVLLDRLPNQEFLDLQLDLDAPALEARLRAAWAVFLPYTFDPALRVMVSTSFSHKFTESIAAGRPILVFGPAHASIPRYFRSEGLPLCAQSPAELAGALGEIESNDNAALIERYRALAERHHSPAALREVLVPAV